MQFTLQQEREHFRGNALRNARKLGRDILYRIIKHKDDKVVELPIPRGNPMDMAELVQSAIAYQQNQETRERYTPKKGITRSPKLGSGNYAYLKGGCAVIDAAKCVKIGEKGKLVVEQPGAAYAANFILENREYLTDVLGNDVF